MGARGKSYGGVEKGTHDLSVPAPFLITRKMRKFGLLMYEQMC